MKRIAEPGHRLAGSEAHPADQGRSAADQNLFFHKPQLRRETRGMVAHVLRSRAVTRERKQKKMRKMLGIFVFAAAAFAESPLMVGVRGGAGFTDSLGGFGGGLGLPMSRAFAIGPTAGLRFGNGLSVEGDALFHRQSLTFDVLGIRTPSLHVDSWQVPVMLKFTAGEHGIAPVFGAGVSFRRMNDVSSISARLLNGLATQNSVGFVAGGGVTFKTGVVSFTPEFRYTRWNSSGLADSVLRTFAGGENQAEVLIGVTF